MSRFLLTWELGMNLGHLARLVPIAIRLRARGHSVLVAVREIPAAAAALGPAGIPFVQAPHLPQGLPLPERASGYADILLSQGWSDPQTLWGLTQNWHNVIRMFRPDAVVIDYSPAAQLATRIAAIPTVLIGNGFELPPATNPLPPFPNVSWATAQKAGASEHIAVGNANAVLSRFKRPALQSLSELFNDVTSLYVTLPELDHYGERPNARYVGPLLGALPTAKVDWPQGSKRVFACLRPDTANVNAILEALRSSGAGVVCFAPGFTRQQLEQFADSNIRFTSRLVDLQYLAVDADACVSYGAEGTVATFLLAAVPQLISPWQVEAHMAAWRVETLGAAVVLRKPQDSRCILAGLDRVMACPQLRERALALSMRHQNLQSAGVVESVVTTIETA